MSEQNYANHAMIDPPFHYFLLPVVGLNLLYRAYQVFGSPSLSTAWELVLAFALVVLALKVRVYALKVQDRVIRLEEQTRLHRLAPQFPGDRVTADQAVGLRFAPDNEVVGLAEKALAGAWSRDQIKRGILQWRPDHFRI
jgi:hypothetical protein